MADKQSDRDVRNARAREHVAAPCHGLLSEGRGKSGGVLGGGGAERQTRSSLVQEMGQGAGTELSYFQMVCRVARPNLLQRPGLQGEDGQRRESGLHFEAGDTGETRTVTYIQLLNIVKGYSASLRGIGVKKGDRVAIYMPMSIEATAMMLACARIGAVHVVIFAGFSPRAIADRVELSGAGYVIAKPGRIAAGAGPLEGNGG